jgi:hypothetical protein
LPVNLFSYREFSIHGKFLLACICE